MQHPFVMNDVFTKHITFFVYFLDLKFFAQQRFLSFVMYLTSCFLSCSAFWRNVIDFVVPGFLQALKPSFAKMFSRNKIIII